MIDEVPDYMACVDDNNRASKCAKHAFDKKTRADIITMNAALTDVFLDALSLQVCAYFQQCCLREPNIIYVDMFEWFFRHYGKTTAEDHNANRQHMAADWHPANGFDTLALCLFTGAAYASCTGYTMANRDIVDIGLHVIKQCGMYDKEYKGWIARKSECPRIVETFDMFKMFWATKITLVSQTAVPTSMHGYGMAGVNNNDSIVSYGKSIANFGTTYAATHESVKSHSLMIASMQGQLQAMQQFCMVLQQQQPPPPSTHRSSNSAAVTVCRVVTLPAAPAEAIQPRRINSQQQRNAICSPSRPSRGLTTGITVAPMAGTSTTPTLAVCAVTQVCHTIHQRQGQTRWEAPQRASTRQSCLLLQGLPHLRCGSNVLLPQQCGNSPHLP